MSGNTNFICYQGYAWSRSFEFLTCDGTFDLDGYSVDLYAHNGSTEILHLSVGDGITISGSIAAASISSTDTGEINTSGLPIMTITEMINQECCGGVFVGPIFDTKTGPTADFRLVLTDSFGNAMAPELIGKFLIYPEQS